MSLMGKQYLPQISSAWAILGNFCEELVQQSLIYVKVILLNILNNKFIYQYPVYMLMITKYLYFYPVLPKVKVIFEFI